MKGSFIVKQNKETNLQNQIRLKLSEHGIVLRLNSGQFWQGKRVYSKELQQDVLIHLRPVQGCPEGTSDLLFLSNNGEVAFIEVKTPTGKLKPAQERFLEIVKQMGFKAGIARSPEEAIKIVKGDDVESGN